MGSDGGEEGLDDFDVVVDDVGVGVDDGGEGSGVAVEVGDEDFDGAVWVVVADGGDGVGEVVCAAVGEVVACDGGDDGVGELEGVDVGGDLGGFGGVGWLGCPGFDVTVVAVAGAGVAEDEEDGGACFEAFGDVGAFGFFADGVEVAGAQECFEVGVGGAGALVDFEPVGVSSGHGGCGEGGVGGF